LIIDLTHERFYIRIKTIYPSNPNKYRVISDVLTGDDLSPKEFVLINGNIETARSILNSEWRKYNEVLLEYLSE